MVGRDAGLLAWVSMVAALLGAAMAGLATGGVPVTVVGGSGWSATKSPPPPRPLLRTRFSAVMKSDSWSDNGGSHATSTQRIAVDDQTFIVVYTNAVLSKDTTWYIDCVNQTQLLVEPFFNETVCYRRAIELPPKMNASNPSEAFLHTLDLFNGFGGFLLTTFTGTQRYISQGWNGTVELWSSNAMHEMTSSMSVKVTTEFYIRRQENASLTQGSGLCLRILKVQVQISKNARGVVTRKTMTTNTVFEQYDEFPKMSLFTPPKNVKCIDFLKSSSAANGWAANGSGAWSDPWLSPLRVQHHQAKPKVAIRSTQPVNNVSEIARLNKANLGWSAGVNEVFQGRLALLRDARALCGTVVLPGALSLRRKKARLIGSAPIPASFDARAKWNHCPTIGYVRQQGSCGGCWAFGAVEVLADRQCITGRNQQIHSSCGSERGAPSGCLSPAFLLDCDKKDGACGGGFLDTAWEFLRTTGAPVESCVPYPYKTTSGEAVLAGQGPAQTCPRACHNGTRLKLYKAASAYAVGEPGDVASIQSEIMQNGPVEAALFVFDDFFSYRNGVYRADQSSVRNEDGSSHAVKLIGWGVDVPSVAERAQGQTTPRPYWLGVNSWGKGWGMQGLFKIARGVNECGIETTVAAGMPE